MSKIFSISLDKGTTFVVVAIIAVTSVLILVFYSIATSTYPQFIAANPPSGFGNFSLLKPPIGNYTGLLNATHKVVNKYGWHPCVEDVGVWCLGHYKVNETVIISKPSIPQCIGPGCPPSPPPLP